MVMAVIGGQPDRCAHNPKVASSHLAPPQTKPKVRASVREGAGPLQFYRRAQMSTVRQPQFRLRKRRRRVVALDGVRADRLALVIAEEPRAGYGSTCHLAVAVGTWTCGVEPPAVPGGSWASPFVQALRPIATNRTPHRLITSAIRRRSNGGTGSIKTRPAGRVSSQLADGATRFG